MYGSNTISTDCNRMLSQCIQPEKDGGNVRPLPDASLLCMMIASVVNSHQAQSQQMLLQPVDNCVNLSDYQIAETVSPGPGAVSSDGQTTISSNTTLQPRDPCYMNTCKMHQICVASQQCTWNVCQDHKCLDSCSVGMFCLKQRFNFEHLLDQVN